MRALKIAGLLLTFNARGEILLGRKKTAEIGAGLINAAGGKWRNGETILQCVVREQFEEFNLVVHTRDLHHIGSLECVVGDELYMRVHVYWTDIFSGTLQETASMEELRWYSPDALPLSQMHEGDPYWFPKAAQREKFRIKIWYERPGEGYIRHEEEVYGE